jgi:hypothetical protein
LQQDVAFAAYSRSSMRMVSNFNLISIPIFSANSLSGFDKVFILRGMFLYHFPVSSLN